MSKAVGTFEEAQKEIEVSTKFCLKHKAKCEYCEQVVELLPVISVKHGVFVILDAMVSHYTKIGRCSGSFSELYTHLEDK